MTFTDKFKAKYSKKRQNLPIIEQKKPSLAECRACSQFEDDRVNKICWCIFKEWDRVKKRSVVHYANIELLECCPKGVKK